MKFSAVLLIAVVVGFVLPGAETLHAYEAPKPSADVEVVRCEWRDAARDREVPAKIYLPKDGAGPFPIIIFSHGLGGSRDGYEYLGRHWAGCGYVSVHLQHHGSDDAVWKGVESAGRARAMREATTNLANTTNRPKDVSFAIDQLIELNGDPSSPRMAIKTGVGVASIVPCHALSLA